jgi:Tfp pilus assembly protein PilF
MKRFKIRKSVLSVVLICLTMAMFACAPELRKPVSAMDTPEHHSVAGLRLLEEDKYKEAEREFSLAIQIDPKFSQAHAGMGLVKAYTGDHKGAAESMKLAWKYADTKEEQLFVHIGQIRLSYKAMAGKGWLNDARDEFDHALKIDPQSSAAYYYMGIAYISVQDFEQAGQMFRKVIDLKKEYVKDADISWNLIQKILRAMPGTAAGKKIALLQRITRADVAALFMEELKIDVFYKKRSIKTFDTSFKDPEKAKNAPAAAAMPKDIADHPLKVDIEGILGVGVRGLETYSDGLFHPGENIDRATYAMMLEDILIKVTGDNTLATKFIGQTSPFPDLRSDLPYFNSVMVVTTRQIMGVKDFTSGEFAPLGDVPGVDALLYIRKIQEELKF